MELFPNKSGLGIMDPIALVNYNVCLITGRTSIYRKVIWYEPLVPFQFLNIGAVAAGSVSARTAGTNLAVHDGEFAQYRWYPEDNVQVNMFLPQTNGRSVLRNLQVPVDMQIRQRDVNLHFTEIFVWEDKVPWFEAINGMDYATLACRLVAQGFRFITEPITDTVLLNNIKAGRADCVQIPCYGQAGQAM